jgi:hypothetical protein
MVVLRTGRDQSSFSSPKSAGQIAMEKRTLRPQNVDQLMGAAADLWSSDEEFDEFLASIDRHRPRSAAQ